MRRLGGLCGSGVRLPAINKRWVQPAYCLGPAPQLRWRPAFGAPSAAASASSSASSTSAAAARGGDQQQQQHELLGWVRQQGGQVSDLVSVEAYGGADGGSGYGLGAKGALPQGAQLVYLPTAAHLTYDRETDASLLRLIDQVPAELWGAKLALQLLAHRAAGASSPFEAYVRNLPVGFQGVPAFFGGAEIGALQYPPVTEQVKMRCRWLVSFSKGALAQRHEQQGGGSSTTDPFGSAEVDANALGWAMAAVTSRAFRTRGPEHPAAMLPLIDMCNHSFNPNATIKPVGSTGVAMVTLREVAAGEPLLLSYGQLSNDFLLMDYGFVVENNPYDDIKLRFDLSLMDAGRSFAGIEQELAPATWQSAALQELRLAGKGAATEVTFGRSPRLVDPRLLAAMRVLSMTDPSELRGRSVGSLGALDIDGLSPRTEALALRSLVGVAALVLSQFPTTLDQDVALLLGANPQAVSAAAAAGGGDEAAAAAIAQAAAAEPLSDNARLAVLFRVEKKRLLVELMQQLAARLKEVSSRAVGTPPGAKGAAPGSAHSGSGNTPRSASRRKDKDSGSPKTKPKKATSKGFG